MVWGPFEYRATTNMCDVSWSWFTWVTNVIQVHDVCHRMAFYTPTLTSWQFHDDVITWKHFPRYWPSVRGIHRSPVNSPHKGQWRGALMFSLICALNKRLSKQSWGWWFETPSRPFWRLCNINLRNPWRHDMEAFLKGSSTIVNYVCLKTWIIIYEIYFTFNCLFILYIYIYMKCILMVNNFPFEFEFSRIHQSPVNSVIKDQ